MHQWNAHRLAIAALFSLLALFIALDLLRAAYSVPCPEAADCYPWGSEGPAAGFWRYNSKSAYLTLSSLQLAALLLAASWMAIKAKTDRPLSIFEKLVPIVFAAAALVLYLM